MDSITHVALGAVIGEAVAGKSLGKRAMFYGAIAQSIPDIDFIAAFFLPASENLLVHRGFTHSFLFGALVTLLLSAIADRIHRPLQVQWPMWFWLFGSEIFVHLLLDACNAYGIGWFEPFAHNRISLHILFVADPFFSIWSGIALVILMSLSSKAVRARRIVIYTSLLLTMAYFVYAVINKYSVERDVKSLLARNNIQPKAFFTTPTPLNTWLWYVVAQDEKGFYTTYRSVNDREDKGLDLAYFPQQNHLLDTYEKNEDVQNLLRFSLGKYTVESRGDTVVFNDLRFGQIAGWTDPRAPFVFHYYINHPEANLLVIQRGRFANWNRKTFNTMVRRIRGE